MSDSVVTLADRGRVRAAWERAHEPVPGVAGWARKAALLVPLVVLPSSVWRISAIALHVPIIKNVPADPSGNLPSWIPIELYVVLLSIVSELLAFTAIGLVSTWGEVFPRWMPFLRGRRVPTLAAVIPGAIGATILTALWTEVLIMLALGRTLTGGDIPDDGVLDAHTWQGLLAIVMYAPLIAWGPLLGAVTFAYYRRRTTKPAGREAFADSGRQ